MNSISEKVNNIINTRIIVNGKISPTFDVMEAMDEVYEVMEQYKDHPLTKINIRINKKYNEAIDKRVKKETRGKIFDCKEGCSTCCHNISFLVSPMEIENIIIHLNKLDNDLKEEIGNKITILDTKFKDYKLNRLTSDDEYLKTVNERHKNIIYDCPFLINDKCSIYESRPIICRTYLSTNKRVCEETNIADNILINIFKESLDKLRHNKYNKMHINDDSNLDLAVPFFIIRYDSNRKKFYSINKYNKFVAFLESKR